jgi:uncharacterized MAPEG superfamily protein
MEKIQVRATARKSRKNKLKTRGGMVGGARAGASIARRAAPLTMRATVGGLPLSAEVSERARRTDQTSPRSHRNSMSNGNVTAPTRDADAEARARVEAIAARILHNNAEAREAFIALKAILLTVILDDGRESVEWELDAGDWVLVRVSDYADLEGRERGDLLPVSEVTIVR